MMQKTLVKTLSPILAGIVLGSIIWLVVDKFPLTRELLNPNYRKMTWVDDKLIKDKVLAGKVKIVEVGAPTADGFIKITGSVYRINKIEVRNLIAATLPPPIENMKTYPSEVLSPPPPPSLEEHEKELQELNKATHNLLEKIITIKIPIRFAAEVSKDCDVVILIQEESPQSVFAIGRDEGLCDKVSTDRVEPFEVEKMNLTGVNLANAFSHIIKTSECGGRHALANLGAATLNKDGLCP
jgi:hypothetical protein